MTTQLRYVVFTEQGWLPIQQPTHADGSLASPPSTPGDLVVSYISAYGAVLEWDPSTVVNDQIDHYEILRDGVVVGATKRKLYDASSLMPETEYTFEVRAVSATGLRSASAIEMATTLADAGWPSAGNTGYSGLLTEYTGPLTFNTDGVVLENLHIRGSLYFNGVGNVIRNCLIESNDFWPCRFMSTNIDGKRSIIEHSTFIGGGNVQAMVYGVNYMGHHLDISGSGDGIRGDQYVLLEDSYVHDLYEGPDTHNDSVDYEGAGHVVIRHNTILNSIGQTSAVTVAAYTGGQPYTDALVERNFMAGGGYTIYGPGTAGPVSDVRIINNTLSTMYFPNFGTFWWLAYDPAIINGNVVANNVSAETGEVLPVGRPDGWGS